MPSYLFSIRLKNKETKIISKIVLTLREIIIYISIISNFNGTYCSLASLLMKKDVLVILNAEIKCGGCDSKMCNKHAVL